MSLKRLILDDPVATRGKALASTVRCDTTGIHFHRDDGAFVRPQSSRGDRYQFHQVHAGHECDLRLLCILFRCAQFHRNVLLRTRRNRTHSKNVQHSNKQPIGSCRGHRRTVTAFRFGAPRRHHSRHPNRHRFGIDRTIFEYFRPRGVSTRADRGKAEGMPQTFWRGVRPCRDCGNCGDRPSQSTIRIGRPHHEDPWGSQKRSALLATSTIIPAMPRPHGTQT